MINTLVAMGIVLILGSLFLKRGRLGRIALIAGVVSLVAAFALSPELLLATADWITKVLDGKPPDY